MFPPMLQVEYFFWEDWGEILSFYLCKRLKIHSTYGDFTCSIARKLASFHRV